jgi:hypothetical protein
MSEVVNSELYYNVPLNPSGTFAEAISTPTTTTPIPPTPIAPLITPDNSGIRDFSIINDYIHYKPINSAALKISHSGYLQIAPRLFNKYNITQRNNAYNNSFISATIYLTSPQ